MQHVDINYELIPPPCLNHCYSILNDFMALYQSEATYQAISELPLPRWTIVFPTCHISVLSCQNMFYPI